MKKVLLISVFLNCLMVSAHSDTESLLPQSAQNKYERYVAFIKQYKHPIKALSCLVGGLSHNALINGVDGINTYLGSKKIRPSIRAFSLFGLMTIPGLTGYKLRQYNIRNPKVRLLTELGRNATITLGSAIITHAILGK